MWTIDFVLLTVTSIWWRMKANIFQIKKKLYKIKKNVKEMHHSYWLLSVKLTSTEIHTNILLQYVTKSLFKFQRVQFAFFLNQTKMGIKYEPNLQCLFYKYSLLMRLILRYIDLLKYPVTWTEHEVQGRYIKFYELDKSLDYTEFKGYICYNIIFN